MIHFDKPTYKVRKTHNKEIPHGIYTKDPVTGYQCVSQGCFSLRLPNADCICVKRNPGETDINKVLLACSTREGGRWVACPVKPRYGISVR